MQQNKHATRKRINWNKLKRRTHKSQINNGIWQIKKKSDKRNQTHKLQFQIQTSSIRDTDVEDRKHEDAHDQHKQIKHQASNQQFGTLR